MTMYPVPKLILDKALSATLLVVLSPIFAFLFAAMGVDMLARPRDRGPFLYRERRISRGREFDLLKFRTLLREVAERIDPAESHARMYEADEANLTWAGRRLLKPRYLDELPQLWNVLRGDMSLVGPRPWPPPMVANQAATASPTATRSSRAGQAPHRLRRARPSHRDMHRSTLRTSSSVAARAPGSSLATTSAFSGERSWSWRRAKAFGSERQGVDSNPQALARPPVRTQFRRSAGPPHAAAPRSVGSSPSWDRRAR